MSQTNKKIYLNESQLELLKESAQDKAAIRFLKEKGVTDYARQMEIIGSLKHDIPNLRLDKGKFIVGALRMFYDHQLMDEQSIRDLDNALKYIHAGNHTDEYDFNLNGKSCEELNNTFREIANNENENDRERSNSKLFDSESNYEVVPIDSYEEAEPYGKYTSWCVTHGNEAFKTYTRGGNRFYFCLKNGFESVPKNNEGAPLNEWGLSMIAVNVDFNGSLTRITTRYNHDFNGENNPGLETTEQLENVINLPFYKTFKPYTREELHQMGIIPLDEIPSELEKGRDPKEIFDYVAEAYDGVMLVELGGKNNYIDENTHKLLSKKWYEYATSFADGIASVKENGKWNLINKNGEILSEIWFDRLRAFFDGFAMVCSNGKWNFVKMDGSLLVKKPVEEWFKFAYNNFEDGFSFVENEDNKWNIIDKEGQLVSKQWFDSIEEFNENIAKISLNRKWNFIKKNGQILWDKSIDEWFDGENKFHNGFAVVKLDGKFNFLDADGNLVWNKPIDLWFDLVVGSFSARKKQAIVALKGNYYCLTEDGNLLDCMTQQPVQLSEGKKHKKAKKPSAMSQVGGKVNAGIMDIVTCGGMCEEDARPENDKYSIGFEDGANSYAHITENSTNFIFTKKQLDEVGKKLDENLLLEGDSRLKKVRAIMQQVFGKSLDLDAVVPTETHYVHGNPNTTWFDYFLYNLKHTFGLMSNADVKYLPFVAKMAYSPEVKFDIEDGHGTEQQELINIVQAIKNDETLWNKVQSIDSYSNLVEVLKPILQNLKDSDDNYANNAEGLIKNTDYDIIEVKNFEEAHEIGNYSSLQTRGMLCYTQGENTWDNFTNHGANRVWCALKKGWKDMEAIPGENAPYDEYGLSMIFVFVDPEGDIAYSNTRWNHENAHNTSVDHSFTKSQLRDLLGVPFNVIFKPYTKEELHKKGIVTLDEVQGLIDSGESLGKIVDSIYGEHYGMRLIKKGSMFNFLTRERKLLSEKWFNFAYDFDDETGVALVSINDKWNFLRADKHFMLNDWPESIINLNNDNYKMFGEYLVTDNDKYNLANKRGNLLLDTWVDKLILNKRNHYSVLIVVVNGKYNIFTENRELGLDEWVDEIDNFDNNGFAVVKDKHKCILIDGYGNAVIPDWYDDIVKTSDYRYYKVSNSGKVNLFDTTEKEFLSDEWFFEMGNIVGNYTVVTNSIADYSLGKILLRKNIFLLDKKRLLFNTWFDSIFQFISNINNAYAKVKLNNKYNFINARGHIISKTWFDDAKHYEPYGDAMAVFDKEKGWNFIRPDGELISNEWFKSCGYFNENASVKVELKNGEIGWLNADGGYMPLRKKENSEMLKESIELKKDDYKKYFKQIGEYMNSHGLIVKPFPKVVLFDEDQDGLFIRTGYYEPEAKRVALFTKDRHPKDILRSFAHEMVHHAQNLRGDNLSFTNADNVKDNEELEKLEAEAYLKGNVYFRKWTEYFKNDGKENLNESVSLDEMATSDVDLSSFKLKRELNPKFWVGEHLDKRIRTKLLDLADDFISELDIDWVEPKDIIMTGSLANYNWDKKYSDIDLHVLLDYEDVDDNVDFVKSYFTAKKDLWNEKHKGLKIFGFPVEVYVQDINEKHNSTGIYSLDKDKWIEEPEYKAMSSHKIDSKVIKKKVAKYATEIDALYDEYNRSKGDIGKIKDINKKAKELFDKIKSERTDGFKKDSSELNSGNLTFKALRRMDYIGKIVDLRDKTYDIINGLG